MAVSYAPSKPAYKRHCICCYVTILLLGFEGVDKDMFGEDDGWEAVAEWLKRLDADSVSQYFEERRYTTRLGDHFAACIEYVLKYSPLLSPEPLFISQQVKACAIQNQQALKKLKKSKGEFGSFGLRKGGVISEVIVKLIENDVLIKRFSSYVYNSRGMVKEVDDSKLESLMAVFKSSPFDYHADKEMSLAPSEQESHQNVVRDGNSVHESMRLLPEHVDRGVYPCKFYKWRVHYSVDESGRLRTGDKAHSNGRPSTADKGLKPESVNMVLNTNIDKNGKAASDEGRSNVSSSGEKTGGGRLSRKVHPLTKKPSSIWRRPIKKKPMAGTSAKTVWKSKPKERLQQHVELEKGRTAGECDFLFKANAKQDASDYSWTHIHHWEVSVHLLSYIGPWEVFGLVTPGSSAWHCSGKRLFAAMEGVNPDLYLEALYQQPNPTLGHDQLQVLDACYVAPTIGDTWFERKKSISSKLQLCRFPNMAAKVSNLFHSSLRESHSFTQEPLATEQKPLLGPQGQDYGSYREDSSILRVQPRALVKGYLFYEPQLWIHLCTRKRRGKLSIEATGDGGSQRVPNFSTSSLNADHWMGWWVYAYDFPDFARSYGHAGSMWYIAPRHEWLSPIIISGSESHRCSRVLDLVDIMTMILKVGEEAARLQPPRQRRFMVVEVRWDPNTRTRVSCPSSPHLRARMNLDEGDDTEGKGGGWVEVSRGFVLETSWPESREELAHGFTLSWSPALLGWS